jgi:bile acid-coenzyme A ligase
MLPTGTSLGAALTQHAAAHPDRPILTCAGVTLVRGELEEWSNRLAQILRQRGVGVGDRVAIVLPNSPEFVAATFAVWKAGGTPVPVSASFPAVERDAILSLADPKAVFGAGRLDAAADAPGPGHHGQSPEAPPDLVPHPWKILPSGGSTGRPKLIATTQRGIVESGVLLGMAAQMAEERTVLITAPLSHNGPFTALTAGLLLGNHAVLTQRFDAAETLRLAELHRADWMYAVPTMMHRIWRLPKREQVDLSALRIVFHLGAPIAPWLKQAWIDWLGPDTIWELYAGTEAQAVTLISGTEWLEHRGSIGRPITGEMQVRDSDGRPLPAGQVGEIWMRASGESTYTYIGADARTSADGWESLGDLGYTDEDGYFYMTDRLDDMLLVGGVNVYPAEIEGALEEHPAVHSAAVVGLPDDDLGTLPHAIVQIADKAAEVTDAELTEHLKTRLAPYKVPRSFERVSHPLRDDAGKIRRSTLRAERVARRTPDERVHAQGLTRNSPEG